MGIFGDLDADQIPDNPFWVREGEYTAQVAWAAIQDHRKYPDGSRKQLVISYTITDQKSEFFNREVRDYFDFYPGITRAELESMDGDQKQNVMRALSSIKARLCGRKGDSNRPGLGVDSSELDGDWKPESLTGLQVDLAVANSGDNLEYTNVKWVNLQLSK